MWSLVGLEFLDVYYDVIVCSFRECFLKVEIYILKKVVNFFFFIIIFGIIVI